MNFFKKFQISIPMRKRRMEKLETLSLGPAQFLHLVRVDGQDYLVLLNGGHPAIFPTSHSAQSGFAAPIPEVA